MRGTNKNYVVRVSKKLISCAVVSVLLLLLLMMMMMMVVVVIDSCPLCTMSYAVNLNNSLLSVTSVYLFTLLTLVNDLTSNRSRLSRSLLTFVSFSFCLCFLIESINSYCVDAAVCESAMSHPCSCHV